MYPLKTIDRGYIAPIHPIPAVVTIILACAALFGMSLTYEINIILGAKHGEIEPLARSFRATRSAS